MSHLESDGDPLVTPEDADNTLDPVDAHIESQISGLQRSWRITDQEAESLRTPEVRELIQTSFR